MAEFPTCEEMAKNVAEKALDDFLYNGKSIREWMQIIASEDCISRKAVLEAIMTNCIWENEYNLTSSRIKKAVESLPSVTPKPKTGRWRKISMDKYIQHATYYYECSKCGNQHIGQANYCPNCGAKMESEG